MDSNNSINQPGRPAADANNGLEAVFTKIQPYLQLGYSFHKACLYASIPYTTYKKYYDENEDFRSKIEREQSQVGLTARRNIVNQINNGDTKLSLRWLESFERKDFSTDISDKTQDLKDNINKLREAIKEEEGKYQGRPVSYHVSDKGQVTGYIAPSWFQNPDTEVLEGEEPVVEQKP